MIEIDPDIVTASGGAGFVGLVAAVLDWLDRRRVDEKFSKLQSEAQDMKETLARHNAEIISIEKNATHTAKNIEQINTKLDVLLRDVGKITGVLGKGHEI